jgi:hypothetical protein
MKRLLTGALTLILSLAASATTLNPIQLLNPAGSTSGQAIVSTGASTAPAWANVTAANLAAQAANTVVANVTASSASPTAFAMPSCSAPNSALQYTSGTGFNCFPLMARTDSALNQFISSSSAQLASVISDETGSGPLVFGTSPSITSPTISGGTINSMSIGATTPNTGAFTTLSATGLISPTSTVGIKGTTTNDSAQAGSVGEVICAQVTNGGSPTGCATNTSTPVSLTNVVPANVTSISLTAGHWDVCGAVQFFPAASTATTQILSWISTISVTLPTNSPFTPIAALALPFAANQSQILPTGCAVIKLTGTTTVFLGADASFNTSTLTAGGYITATRRR